MADEKKPATNKLICDAKLAQMVVESQLLGIETKELAAARQQLGAGPKEELALVSVDNKTCIRTTLTKGPSS